MKDDENSVVEITFISDPWSAWTCSRVRTVCFSDPFLSSVITTAERRKAFLCFPADAMVAER